MPDVSVGRSLSTVGGSAVPSVQTINSRLCHAADRLTHLNNLAESVLSCIHGTPNGSDAGKGSNTTATPPMTSSLGVIEGELERFARLVESLQQVA